MTRIQLRACACVGPTKLGLAVSLGSTRERQHCRIQSASWFLEHILKLLPTFMPEPVPDLLLKPTPKGRTCAVQKPRVRSGVFFDRPAAI